jgi:GNAT superfamily N-acetyltransferase
MTDVALRPIRIEDLPRVASLLDDALGTGFWDLDLDAIGSHLVAVLDGGLVGVASATVIPWLRFAPELPGPVGLVRIVAVSPEARGAGIATRLTGAIDEECLRLGAASLAAFAWVHAGTKRGALAGVLERLGYRFKERLDGFYATGSGTEDCPACEQNPCVCMADLYVR